MTCKSEIQAQTSFIIRVVISIKSLQEQKKQSRVQETDSSSSIEMFVKMKRERRTSLKSGKLWYQYV